MDYDYEDGDVADNGYGNGFGEGYGDGELSGDGHGWGDGEDMQINNRGYGQADLQGEELK
jgi:hypothetical protein